MGRRINIERCVENDRECGETRESFGGIEACLYYNVFVPQNHERKKGLKRFFDSYDISHLDQWWRNAYLLLFTRYIKNFQVYDPHRVGRIHRMDNTQNGQYTERTLPTREWSYVVITIPDGILDHEEAIKRNVGGQVLGFFY